MNEFKHAFFNTFQFNKAEKRCDNLINTKHFSTIIVKVDFKRFQNIMLPVRICL